MTDKYPMNMVNYYMVNFLIFMKYEIINTNSCMFHTNFINSLNE